MTRAMLAVGVAVAWTVVATADDKKPFEGKWTIESMTRDGKADDALKEATHSVTGDKFAVTPVKDSKADPIEGTFTVNAEKKTIDIKPTSGRFKDKTLLGVYKIDGDTATVAFCEPDKERPKGFESKEGSGVMVEVMKKVK